MEPLSDQGTEPFHDNLDSAISAYDWNHLDYADISDYGGVSTVDDLLDLTDTFIASNSYLVTSDIIFND